MNIEQNIICIDSGFGNLHLTHGKVYKSIKISDEYALYRTDYYRVIDDLGYKQYIKKYRFLTMEEWRHIQFKKIGI